MKKKTRKSKPKAKRKLRLRKPQIGSLRLHIQKGNYAVAVLLAQSRLNYTLTKLLCEIVQAFSIEAARTFATHRAQQQYGAEGWVVAETCVTSINQ